MKFRIKQIDDDKYIPQLKEDWFSGWVGIDNRWNDTWREKSFQTKYCAKSTLLEAQQEIDIYKTRIHKKKNYPKYYKL